MHVHCAAFEQGLAKRMIRQDCGRSLSGTGNGHFYLLVPSAYGPAYIMATTYGFGRGFSEVSEKRLNLGQRPQRALHIFRLFQSSLVKSL